MYLRLKYLFIMTFLVPGLGVALTPMESLILGDLTEYYRQERVDPLTYVFTLDQRLEATTDQEHLRNVKENLALYRANYQEGVNLDNYCRRQPEMSYPTRFDREQALRSVLATVQYLVLDLSVRSIAKYAKELEVTPSEYSDLVDNLMGQYCSKNISIISLDQLRKNLIERYQGENSFILPTIEDNPLFPESLRQFVHGRQGREKQFVQTMRLFKTACSWGGETDNKRLLPPLLKNPTIMAFVFRQLTSRGIRWEESDNTLRIVDDLDTIQVNCQNLICRRVERERFLRDFPRQIGTSGLADDLRRLYCHEFRDADYQTRDQVPQLATIIRQMTFDQQNLLVGQFLSLISGIPDFILHGEEYSDVRPLAKATMNRVWDSWAEEQIEEFKTDLMFEEPLTIEVVERTQYFNPFVSNFKVVVDINLGEFDRINQRKGKINSLFHLNVSKAFLQWARREWQTATNLAETRENILSRFSKKIRPQVLEARDRYSITPWTAPLENLIAVELMEQLVLYRGDNLLENHRDALVKIPIEVNFGLFALRYMRYRQQIRENEDREEKFRETHERLRNQALGHSNVLDRTELQDL